MAYRNAEFNVVSYRRSAFYRVIAAVYLAVIFKCGKAKIEYAAGNRAIKRNGKRRALFR